MVLWPSTQQILTFLHIFDYFGLKLTSIIYDVIMTPMVFDMICNISFGILIKFPIRLDIICWVKSYLFAIKMTLKAIFTQKKSLKMTSVNLMTSYPHVFVDIFWTVGDIEKLRRYAAFEIERALIWVVTR